jgi:hypothetical protein
VCCDCCNYRLDRDTYLFNAASGACPRGLRLGRVRRANVPSDGFNGMEVSKTSYTFHGKTIRSYITAREARLSHLAN